MWAEGAAGRQGWALNAYDRFCKKLSQRTRDSLPEARAETMIVLYGPTQVGKTTLLLQLMGIKDSLKHVSDVLRGGSALGRSATATAMIYDISPGELWQLEGREVGLNDDEMKQALVQIRKDVEAGQAHTRPVTVHIPARYFNTERSTTPRVRILDLPGINPANANEAELVRRTAKEFVPLADLVVLITRADDLGFLQPWTLTAQELRMLDWRAAPSRFCIVTSYLFKLGTLQSWLKEEGEARSVAGLRAHMVKQMHTFGMEVDRPDLLYPLDYGNSWEESPIERRNMVQPMMDELCAELHKRIAESAQPLGRLRHAQDAYHVAEKLQETTLAEHKNVQEKSKKELDDRAVRLESWRQQSERRRERLRMLPGAATVDQARRDLQLEINKKLDGMRWGLPAVDDEEAMTKSCLLRVARQFQMSLGHCVSNLKTLAPASDEAEEILRLMMPGFDERQFSEHAATSFTEFKRQLDGYALDDYWLFVPGRNFVKDRAWLSTCMEDALEDAKSKLGAACALAARARTETLADQGKLMKRDLRRVEARIKRLEVEQIKQEAEIALRDKQTAKIQRDLAEDQKRAKQFNALLRAALYDDLRARREALAKELAPARRFMRLLEAVSVCDQAHKQLDISKTTTKETP
jgi:hypothetical protein